MKKPALSLLLAAAAVLSLLFPVLPYASDGSYEKGVAYLRAGKAEEALRILEPLAAKDPKDPYLLYHAGLAYYKLGRLGEAYGSLVKAKEAASVSSITTGFNFAAAFTNLGSAFYKSRELDKARLSLAKAIEDDPGDGDAHYYMGLVKADKKEFTAALSEFEKARAAKSGDARTVALIRNAAGRAWYGQERYAEAAQEFSAALDSDPGNFEALYYMGMINYKENGYSAAKPYFDQIDVKGEADEKTKDALSTAFFNIGVDYQNRDQAGPAAEMFERAIKLRPNDADAHYYRGYNLFSLERYEEAASEFRQVLSLRPDMSRAKAQLEVAQKASAEAAMKEARDAMARGEFGSAVASYEKASALDPSNSNAAKGLREAKAGMEKDIKEKSSVARSALENGDLTKAREIAGRLAGTYPSSRQAEELKKEVGGRIEGEIRSLMAKAKDAVQRDALGEASACYEKIIVLNPADDAAGRSLSQAQARIRDERAKAASASDEGRFLQARRSYERLLKYLPDDRSAIKGLEAARARISAEITKNSEKAQEYYSSSDWEKAASMADKVLELDPQNQGALSIKKKAGARIQEAEAARASQERQASQPAASEEDIRRLYLEGVEHYTKGELKEAAAKWREVLRLDPRNEKAAGSLAKAEEKIKEGKAAQ